MKKVFSCALIAIFIIALFNPSYAGKKRAWRKTHEKIEKRQAEMVKQKETDTLNCPKLSFHENPDKKSKTKITKLRHGRLKAEKGNQYAQSNRYSFNGNSNKSCVGGNCGGRSDRQKYMRRW